MTRRSFARAILAALPALAGLPRLLLGAPAPRKKKDPPLTMLGDFTETWDGRDFAAWFRDDATCGAVSGEERWRGTWTLRGRKLEVTEECGERWLTWDVALDEKLAGTAVIRAAGNEDSVGKKVRLSFAKA